MQKDKRINNNKLCEKLINKEKIIALIASVKEREETLRLVIDSVYDQVDVIHLVLNYYNEVPTWLIQKYKVQAHLNPTNQNAHDSVWNFIWEDGYYLVLDDDLNYPADYVEKLIQKVDDYKKEAVITVHAARIVRPVKSYFDCRNVYHFICGLSKDYPVDMAGCGTIAFHSSTINPLPTISDFPIPFCRDLWFSILCAKNCVPIIAIERPASWISPLVVYGDTVFDTSKKNKTLLETKDRILKEIFLPLLYCDRDDNKYCLISDYSFDKRLLAKTLSTLDNVTKCNKIIFSDIVKHYGKDILTQYVIPKERSLGKMGSKVLTQYRFIKNLPDNSRVISADADLYFVKDPFIAFEQDFDLAITTRPFKHHYITNYGIVMFRVNDKTRNFLDFIISQIFERTWPELIEYQKSFGHSGNEWCVGQDAMSVAWLYREDIQKRFGIKIVDIGPDYNYCPHADGVYTELGKDQLMKAYREKKVSVLHLKSRLRELLFDGVIE